MFCRKNLRLCNFIKKSLHHRRFPVKFSKVLKAPTLKNICERLLLTIFTKSSIIDIWQSPKYSLFLIAKAFVSNARLNLAKNQANTKQHLEAELLLFKNYSHSLSMLSSKNNRRILKTSKRRSVSVFTRLYD